MNLKKKKKNTHINPNHYMSRWWNEDNKNLRRKHQEERKKWKEKHTKECQENYKWNAVVKNS